MVYNDINESEISFKYGKLKFYFSSEFYKLKFERLFLQFLKDETMKLKIKYKCNIVADEMILILLYKKIEKRGFRVYYKEVLMQEQYFVSVKINDIFVGD